MKALEWGFLRISCFKRWAHSWNSFNFLFVFASKRTSITNAPTSNFWVCLWDQSSRCIWMLAKWAKNKLARVPCQGYFCGERTRCWHQNRAKIIESRFAKSAWLRCVGCNFLIKNQQPVARKRSIAATRNSSLLATWVLWFSCALQYKCRYSCFSHK